MRGLNIMKNLIDEAKDIVEMSLSAKIDHESYSLKANDWLKKLRLKKSARNLIFMRANRPALYAGMI